MDIETLKTKIRELADGAWDALEDEHRDRQLLLEHLISELQRLTGPAPTHVKVILFKPDGKYYTEEDWRIPPGAIVPAAMRNSPDFHRIDGGAVLVESQEPWGWPHLFPAEA
jgi:hypothetical protein